MDARDRLSERRGSDRCGRAAEDMGSFPRVDQWIESLNAVVVGAGLVSK
jgi:hypothetical protein